MVFRFLNWHYNVLLRNYHVEFGHELGAIDSLLIYLAFLPNVYFVEVSVDIRADVLVEQVDGKLVD